VSKLQKQAISLEGKKLRGEKTHREGGGGRRGGGKKAVSRESVLLRGAVGECIIRGELKRTRHKKKTKS